MNRRTIRPGISHLWVGFILFAVVIALTACNPALPVSGSEERVIHELPFLKVVATTTIVGDVVRQVGGDVIDLHVILPVNADPHTFEPTPQDLAIIAEADVVFVNGLGLEEFLDRLLRAAEAEGKVVVVSDGIQVRRMDEDHDDTDDHAEDEHIEDEDDRHDHEEGDPHVWTDPANVIIWVENIQRAFANLDPANAQVYSANAEETIGQLIDLDDWISSQIVSVPEENRKLVTDHETFGYFADRYGFEQVGAVIPGFSTGVAPSAQELAGLVDRINELGVKAIFVGSTVNPDLARRVAEDAGLKIIPLYTDSLTDPSGEAGSYLDFMRTNVAAIVEALR